MSCSQPRQVTPVTNLPWGYGGMRRFAPASFLLFAGLLFLPPETRAQQWLFTPEFEIAAQHLDNPRLNEGVDTDAITGGLVDLGLALRRNTETSSVLLRPSAVIYRYSGDTNEDSEAYFLDFNAETTGQRSSWRIFGDYSRQQVFRGETTSSELDEIDVDESVQTGTGRTFVPRERDLWRLGPGVTLELTERMSLDVDFNYLDVRYDTESFGEAVDYSNSRIDAALVRALSPDSDLAFGVFAARYDPDELERETDSIGAGVRYSKTVSDVSSFFVDLGALDAERQSVAGAQSDDSETSFLWNIGYNRQLEVTRWHFDLGQNVTPSGTGALVERNLFRAIMEHQFQPRWSVRLSAVVMYTENLGGEVLISENKRDYLQGRAVLSYEMSRNWTFEGLYGLTHQDFDDLPGDAQEHEVRLSFIYRPPLPTS